MEKPGSPDSISGKQNTNLTVVGGTDPMVVGRTDPMVVGEMDPMEVGAANPMVIGGMNPTVIGEMNPMGVGAMNPTVVGAMNPMVIGQMNPTVIGEMNPTVVGAMNPMVIGQMNPTVRKAIDALQRGEVGVWLSLFVENAVLYDHGNAMTAGEFIEKSAGREYFTRIDRTDDTGTSVFGRYHTVQWGDFLVGFRFGVVGEEDLLDRICRLDVSQTFV